VARQVPNHTQEIAPKVPPPDFDDPSKTELETPSPLQICCGAEAPLSFSRLPDAVRVVEMDSACCRERRGCIGTSKERKEKDQKKKKKTKESNSRIEKVEVLKNK
jgi:hypothetical protein